MPRIPGINHRAAIKALQRAGFQVIRESKHVILSNGETTLVIPRNNPIKPVTMGAIAKQAGLSPEAFRQLL